MEGLARRRFASATRLRSPRRASGSRERIAFFEFLQFAADEAWPRDARRSRATRRAVLMGDLSVRSVAEQRRRLGEPRPLRPHEIGRCAARRLQRVRAALGPADVPLARRCVAADGAGFAPARAAWPSSTISSASTTSSVSSARSGFDGETPNGFDPPSRGGSRSLKGARSSASSIDEARPAKIVAEDLGTIPEFVLETLGALDVPGYKVLRWQRDDDGFDRSERPIRSARSRRPELTTPIRSPNGGTSSRRGADRRSLIGPRRCASRGRARS